MSAQRAPADRGRLNMQSPGLNFMHSSPARTLPASAADRLSGWGMPRWYRDPVQIVSQYYRPAERHRRLRGKLLPVVMLVALREMGEHEQPRPGLGRDAAGLPGG
jgi:hypothetical protein